MSLTPKREKFAQGVASGMSQADAYRAAFDCSKSKHTTVQSKASILMANGMVRARVDELREKLAEKALWTREMAVKTLIGVIMHPDKSSDIISSVKELNSMHGFDKPENSTSTDNAPQFHFYMPSGAPFEKQ